MIGLGMAAIGVGTRATVGHVAVIRSDTAAGGTATTTEQTEPIGGKTLAYIIVLLTCVGAVGLGIAFLGLAYHHHRRYHEFLREHGGAASVAPRV
jgi:hypothetical protein